MANFFAKSKAEPSIPLTGKKEAAEATDFDTVFKPFALRRGVEVAPINYFGAHRRSLNGVEENPIVVFGGKTPLPPLPAHVIQSLPVNLPGVIRVSFS